MWLVAKIKFNERAIFKKELSNAVNGDIVFYDPKIIQQKIIKNKIKIYNKPLLDSYVFCHNKNFNNTNLIRQLSNTKGLNFFLVGCIFNQKEITNFIEHCKKHENVDGYIKSTFFKAIIIKRAKFLSGPFVNMFFNVIEKQKKKMKIIIGNIVTTIPDSKNYLYLPV